MRWNERVGMFFGILGHSLNQKGFEYLFTQGLYQAGFIAAHKNGSSLLNWWAKICLYICEINESKGIYADQTHLNLLPLQIFKHEFCLQIIYKKGYRHLPLK